MAVTRLLHGCYVGDVGVGKTLVLGLFAQVVVKALLHQTMQWSDPRLFSSVSPCRLGLPGILSISRSEAAASSTLVAKQLQRQSFWVPTP